MARETFDLDETVRYLRQLGSDHTSVEAKRAKGGCPELGATLSAFGNMPNGGVIILGLDEDQGFVATGVGNPALVSEGVASQARTSVVPPVQIELATFDFEDVQIVVGLVSPTPLHSRPTRFQGRAYLRQGDGDYVMSEEEVQQVYAMRSRPRHDAAPVPNTSTANLDTKLTQAFIRQAKKESKRLRDHDDLTVLHRR